MIHTSNETAIDQILLNIEDSVDNFQENIDSIVIPDKINITKYNENYTPILSVSQGDFQAMKKFNFQAQEQNYYVFIICITLFLLIIR